MGLEKKTMAQHSIYFFQRKQYIENNNDIKYLLEFVCCIPQGYIFGPLRFLICDDNFYRPCKSKSVMFAEDTNLFTSNKSRKAI